MKHAGPAALDQLEPLLAALRALPALKERARGCFYWKSRAFVHFHEDPAGLFADVRAADDGTFERMAVTAPDGQGRLLRAIRDRLTRLGENPGAALGGPSGIHR